MIDDEKLDFIESQPPSDDEGQIDIRNSSSYYQTLSQQNQGLHTRHGHQQQLKEDTPSPSISDTSSYHGRFGFYHQNKSSFHHLLAFLISTGLFIPAVVIHKEGNILVLSLLYGAIVWWLVARHLPDGTISGPVSRTWTGGAAFIREMLPLWLIRTIGYGIPPVALILTAVLRPNDSNGTRGQRLISCLGLVVLLSLTTMFSKVNDLFLLHHVYMNEWS